MRYYGLKYLGNEDVSENYDIRTNLNTTLHRALWYEGVRYIYILINQQFVYVSAVHYNK